MTTAISSFSIEPGAEPFPGYRLEKRIGSGGYGEVWRATAPGGLAKAIKIVHGHANDDRAIRELRSLDRAKSLNHPFLISIERIEVVDGHVIIVTELADATLRDRFEQCCAQGGEGIPRAELIEYLREAADALDYLFDGHALAHLDIKPENLLLRGKHVKVADFGLLKDLQDNRGSLVDGMTPKYAAPELFEGKPGRHSDQYSLAIVYHEMLTGMLPFSGGNIACLASQHLHATPDLSRLTPLERFAVGKALSKNPEHRFASCQAFVERLMHRSASILPADSVSTANVDARSRAESTRDRPPCPPSDSNCHDGHTIQTAAPEIRSLPRLLPPEAPITYRPTVFIGIGGLGGRVLAKLRELVTDRIGEAKGLPAFQFLYIDTDDDTLAGVEKGPSHDGLTRDEVFIAPLRQTQDYRSATVSKLDSLSRRWIYNVPRSLRTQGLRALGRIALLDHAERLLERVRRAVTRCTDAESVAATAQQSGLCICDGDPRVFVVASIGGGTGSGMMVDAGYAIRQVLAECGFTDEYVCGMLAFSAASGPGSNGVAPANALACLEELRYFAQHGCDYPGEPLCGLAGFHQDGPTFPSTYLFEVPAPAPTNSSDQGCEALAEYLYASTISPSSALLDSCRREERARPGALGLQLRTAGIRPVAAADRDDPGMFVERLCRLLVCKWKIGARRALRNEDATFSETDCSYDGGDLRDEDRSAIKNLGQAEMDRIGLNLLSLRQRIVAAMTSRMGVDPRMLLRKVVNDSLSGSGQDQGQAMPSLDSSLKRIRTVVGVGGEVVSHRSNHSQSIADLVRQQAHGIGVQLGDSLACWIVGLIDSGSSCVDGARRAAKWIEDLVVGLQQAATAQAEASKHESANSARNVVALASHAPSGGKEAAVKALLDYAEHQLSVLIHEGIAAALRAVNPLVTVASDQLRETWKDLSQLAVKFETASNDAGQGGAAVKNETAVSATVGPPRMADLFERDKLTLLEDLDRSVERQLSKEGRRLRQILAGGGHQREDLAEQMRAGARKIILQSYYRGLHDYFHQALQNGRQNELALRLVDCLRSARPDLLDLGGAKRLLLNVPKQLDVVQLAREFERIAHERVSVSIEQDGDVQVCYEIEELPWDGIETKLIRQRHDCRDLARRLHTRINLDFTVA